MEMSIPVSIRLWLRLERLAGVATARSGGDPVDFDAEQNY